MNAGATNRQVERGVGDVSANASGNKVAAIDTEAARAIGHSFGDAVRKMAGSEETRWQNTLVVYVSRAKIVEETITAMADELEAARKALLYLMGDSGYDAEAVMKHMRGEGPDPYPKPGEVEALREVANAASDFANDREPGLAYHRMVAALEKTGVR